MLAPVQIDHGFEATPERLGVEAARARAWRGADVLAQRCVLRLDDAVLGELREMVRRMRAEPLPLLLRRADHFELPVLRAVMARARHLLDHAQGVAVIDALPLDELDPDSAHALFWVLGELVGRQVAQKWDGTMLYDVRDTGQKYGYGVRGSYTSVELVFHTDNAFAVCPPDYVGLMCLHPAREGGISRFCSLYAIHEQLRALSPDALERLYHPMLWDRQAEHEPDAPRVLRAPMFRCVDGRLHTRANVSLVRKGYQVAGQDMDTALADALDAVETVSREPSLWFELPIARGHLQYLNNVDTAHYRSDFVDHDDPARKRHLVRSWHRERGRPLYDG